MLLEMISRMMSEVPSSISSSLASRIHCSTGNSREYPHAPSVWTAAEVQGHQPRLLDAPTHVGEPEGHRLVLDDRPS